MREHKHPDISQIDLTDLMYALSDPVRVEMLQKLAQASQPLTCGELTGERPKSSMSHHFKILRASGLLRTSIEGIEHINTLRLAEIEEKFPGILESIIRYVRKNGSD